MSLPLLHVITVHYRHPDWIPTQAGYMDRFLPSHRRSYASLEGIPDYYSEWFDAVGAPVGTHADKLDELGTAALENADSSDWLLFIDGDAFPISPLDPSSMKDPNLITAVCRAENLDDPQPHPCYCLISAQTWDRIGGTWQAGFTWTNSLGDEVTDVGAELLRLVQTHPQVEWQQLLRTNTLDFHPLFYAIYGHHVYHHGAGFRTPTARVAKLSQGASLWSSRLPGWMSSEQVARYENTKRRRLAMRIRGLGTAPYSASEALVDAIHPHPSFVVKEHETERSKVLRNWILREAQFASILDERVDPRPAPVRSRSPGCQVNQVAVGPDYRRALSVTHHVRQTKRYLEIGVANGRSLRLAPPTTQCVGVDPAPKINGHPPENRQVVEATSDAFFETYHSGGTAREPFDLIFIDGLHTAEQALKDFLNAEAAAASNAVVLIHDTVPPDEYSALPQRMTRTWTGDVWKVIPTLRHFLPDLRIATFGFAPSGLTAVVGLCPTREVQPALLEEMGEYMEGLVCRRTRDLAVQLKLVPGSLELLSGFVSPEYRRRPVDVRSAISEVALLWVRRLLDRRQATGGGFRVDLS